jgi:selenocysteine lyase/cysteine desulfurase
MPSIDFILLPMMIAALKQVLHWKPENIQAYCADLMTPVLSELASYGFQLEDEQHRAHHLFGIRLPKGIAMDRLQNQLKAYRVNVSVRGDAVRVSPHLYNDKKDVNRLLRALEASVN